MKITVEIEGMIMELFIGKVASDVAKKLKKKAKNDIPNFVRSEELMGEIGLPTYSQIGDLVSINHGTTISDIRIKDDSGKVYFDGSYFDLETDYDGSYNEENIIGVSKSSDGHEYDTVVVDCPVLCTYISDNGVFFKSEFQLPKGEKFDLNKLSIAINEVKINTDQMTEFESDFITEVRYGDVVLENLISQELSTDIFASILIAP
jgi:hypothetical protein